MREVTMMTGTAMCEDHNQPICSECGYCELDPEHLKHTTTQPEAAAVEGDKMMTLEEVMHELDLSDDEFENAYREVLLLVRAHGTYGVRMIFNYVEQELAAGNENL
jgi:hypothetical protein